MDIAYSAAEWGGFGTTVATAAATLTGLLFIAVSLNLAKILSYDPLPGRAGETLVFFVIPLTFALLLVVPGQARAALGGELIATAVVTWLSAQWVDRQAAACTGWCPRRSSPSPRAWSTPGYC